MKVYFYGKHKWTSRLDLIKQMMISKLKSEKEPSFEVPRDNFPKEATLTPQARDASYGGYDGIFKTKCGLVCSYPRPNPADTFKEMKQQEELPDTSKILVLLEELSTTLLVLCKMSSQSKKSDKDEFQHLPEEWKRKLCVEVCNYVSQILVNKKDFVNHFLKINLKADLNDAKTNAVGSMNIIIFQLMVPHFRDMAEEFWEQTLGREHNYKNNLLEVFTRELNIVFKPENIAKLAKQKSTAVKQRCPVPGRPVRRSPDVP